MFKSNKGITLVALVITIIVLLILAGVTLMLALGDKGIITQAGNAKAAQIEAEVTETMNMAILAARTEMAATVATKGSAKYAMTAATTGDETRTVDEILTESLPSNAGYSVTGGVIKYETDAYRNAKNKSTAYIEAVVVLTTGNQSINTTQAPTVKGTT